jgi:transcription antitermination factor NusG
MTCVPAPLVAERFIPRAVADVTEPWWMARCMGNQEQQVESVFQKLRVDYVIPFERIVYRRPTGERRERRRAVFNGYVFFAGDSDIRWSPMLIRKLFSPSQPADQPRLSALLAQWQEWYAGEPKPQTCIARGTTVEVKSGAFMGLRGPVDKVVGDCVWIDVPMLGRVVSLEVPTSDVETAA